MIRTDPLRFCTLLLALVLIAASVNERVAAQPADGSVVTPDSLTAQEVEWAIEALIDGLYRLQQKSGTWERQFSSPSMAHLNSHSGGQTAMAALALLMAGQSYQEPRLQPAIDFLTGDRTDYTYVRSLRAHVWALLPERFTPILNAERDWLLRAFDYDAGSWNYTDVPMGSAYDNSLTQYGVLGLWEAAKRRREVPDRIWKRVEEHFLRVQLADGGWNYRPQWSDSRGSMTAAGLTCLFITQDYLHAPKYVKPGVRGERHQIAIENGLKWLDWHFTADFHPGAPGEEQEYYFFYYLYGIERVGLASGYKRFGELDWFRHGAAAIVNRMLDPVLEEDGRQIGFTVRNSITSTGPVEPPVVQLSFALMFLARGHTPIVVNKIRDDAFAWNNRPSDARNLARWVSDQTETPSSWQILDLDRPLEEWFDAPFVWLTSHEPLPFAIVTEPGDRPRAGFDPQRAAEVRSRLKRYLELGGLLVTNADASSRGFTESVYALGAAMFPEYEWRELPEDHWAYTLSASVSEPPRMYGLSNGVRDLMIHAPLEDPAVALQLNDATRQESIFQTFENLYYYASERGLTRRRLEPKTPFASVDHPFAPPADAPGPTYTIIRASYRGASDPEPLAAEMLSRYLYEERGWRVNFITAPLHDLGVFADDPESKFAWISGVEAREFDDAERAALDRFLSGGGVVLFETVGGRGGFGRSAEEVIESIDPEVRFRRQSRHPVITGAGLDHGRDCSEIRYRLFSLEDFGGRDRRPRLRAAVAKSAGRFNVFVSREDLSHALLGQPRWGISGYVTEDAVALLGNLIAYANGE
ncbi:MAG: DUF4159 domain-containing protein [Phycisphaerales bacterium]